MTALYFALTFALSWTCWLAASRLPRQGASLALFWVVTMTGVFAPAIVALPLTRLRQGRDVRALLRRMALANVPLRFYIFAVTYMAAIKLIAALVHRAATGAWPRFGTEPLWVIALAIPLSTPFQSGEELGWRGYALPRMAERMGLPLASIVLGVIWALWHLPFFFFNMGGDQTGQSVPLYVLQVTALSVAIAWLWRNTNGSLLLTMLMHSAINQTKDIVPSIVPGATNPWAWSTSLPAQISLALMSIAAVFFLWQMRGARGVRSPGRPIASSPLQHTAGTSG